MYKWKKSRAEEDEEKGRNIGTEKGEGWWTGGEMKGVREVWADQEKEWSENKDGWKRRRTGIDGKAEMDGGMDRSSIRGWKEQYAVLSSCSFPPPACRIWVISSSDPPPSPPHPPLNTNMNRLYNVIGWGGEVVDEWDGGREKQHENGGLKGLNILFIIQ